MLSINNFIKPSLPPTPSVTQTQDDISSHQQHVQQSQIKSTFKCNLCRKHISNAQKLQEHLIDHTFAGCEDRGYICYLCSSVFTSSAGLQNHIADHGPQAKPYDCNHCDEAFYFRAELEHHLIDHELGKVHLVTKTSSDLAVTQDIKSEIIESASKADEETHSENAPETNVFKDPEENLDINEKLEEAEEDDEYIEVEHNVEEGKKNENGSNHSENEENSNDCSE